MFDITEQSEKPIRHIQTQMYEMFLVGSNVQRDFFEFLCRGKTSLQQASEHWVRRHLLGRDVGAFLA